MSFLDLYSRDQAADAAIRPTEGANLPTTFGDAFDASWSAGRLFSQSVAGDNARGDALQDYIDEIQKKTGKNVGEGMNFGGEGGAIPMSMLLAQANDAVTKMKAVNPDLDLQPLNDDDLEQRAIAKSRAAKTGYAEMAGTEKTFGGKVGFALGGLANAAVDPINLLALPIAPEMEGIGILAAAMRWGGVAAGSQAAIEAAGGPYREAVQPGYTASGEPVANIAEAFGGGAVLGGATKALGNLWTRAKTGSWPTSVRDAGNIVESHANVIDSNVYLGAEGEAAHWDALNFSIDNVLHGEPVDVQSIITPRLEEQSHNLIARLEGERAASLPIYDARAVRLVSEEAGLRARDAELATHIDGLPEGNATSADRLNRLQAVEQQISGTNDSAAIRALNERRDQILVDTTPERLAAEAAPFEQRRAAEAERSSIASRLEAINNERLRIHGENLNAAGPAMFGQRQPVRAVPIEEIRAHAAAAARTAEDARLTPGGEPAPELPFAATGAEADAQAASDALVSGVQQVAKRAGYDMPPDEAGTIAARLTKMSPDEAQDTFRDLQSSPHQVADHPDHTWPEPREPAPPDPVAAKATASADFEKAVRSDIDRERMVDDRKIPVDVDKDGNVTYRSLDEMADEVDAYLAAADHIQACAAPAPAKEST